MDASLAARYWCHMCSRMVNPLLGDEIKCPLCQSGFVEEMENNNTSNNSAHHNHNHNHGSDGNAETDFLSDRTLSLWAPVFQGMMTSPHRRRRSRRPHMDDDNVNGAGMETQLDHDPESSFIRRRRRSPASIFQMVQEMQTEMPPQLTSSEVDRERVILINPYNQTIIVQGSYDPRQSIIQNQNQTSIGSFGDYFIGPGLDMLLQHLAENDSTGNSGIPPARKEAVEAMPTVKIKELVQCAVCLDDFEIGSEGKEMPCKHKFHKGCITPWLALHNSCPVCRFQLPGDESKPESNMPSSNSNAIISAGSNNNVSNGEARSGTTGHRRRFSIPWLFNNMFSSSGSSGNGNPSSSSSSTNARSHRDNN